MAKKLASVRSHRARIRGTSDLGHRAEGAVWSVRRSTARRIANLPRGVAMEEISLDERGGAAGREGQGAEAQARRPEKGAGQGRGPEIHPARKATSKETSEEGCGSAGQAQASRPRAQGRLR